MWMGLLTSRFTLPILAGVLVCLGLYVQQSRIHLLQEQLGRRQAEILAVTFRSQQCDTTVKRQNLAIENLQQRAAVQSDRAVVAAKKVLSALDSRKKAIASGGGGAEEMNAWLNDLFPR